LKILVTGATGFIGRHLVPCLIEKGYNITCLIRDDKKAGTIPSHSQVSFIHGDITHTHTLDLDEDFEYVIHLAAMGHVSAASEEAYKQFVNINEIGTQNLIAALSKSKNLKKFIHFSSTAAMGPIGTPILDESSFPAPRTPYQKSKYRSEQVVLDAFKSDGFPAVVLRPCMVYGPGGTGEFHKFCKLFKKGHFPKVGCGDNLTPIVYVTDVVQATLLALEHSHAGETYIIASSESYPMGMIRANIVKNLGINPPYIYTPLWLALFAVKCLEILYSILGKTPIATTTNIKSTVVDRTFDITKARTQLGYVPQMPLEKGIETTVLWLKKEKLL